MKIFDRENIIWHNVSLQLRQVWLLVTCCTFKRGEREQISVSSIFLHRTKECKPEWRILHVRCSSSASAWAFLRCWKTCDVEDETCSCRRDLIVLVVSPIYVAGHRRHSIRYTTNLREQLSPLEKIRQNLQPLLKHKDGRRGFKREESVYDLKVKDKKSLKPHLLAARRISEDLHFFWLSS